MPRPKPYKKHLIKARQCKLQYRKKVNETVTENDVQVSTTPTTSLLADHNFQICESRSTEEGEVTVINININETSTTCNQDESGIHVGFFSKVPDDPLPTCKTPTAKTTQIPSPTCHPLAISGRKKRLFNLRSPKVFNVLKGGKTYSKLDGGKTAHSLPETFSEEVTSRLPLLQGRRLITIDSINLLINETEKHATTCHSSALALSRENRNGLWTTLVLKCANCNEEVKINLDSGRKSLKVNEAAVWAGNTTGAGFTSLKHSMTVLDIPFISKSSYLKLEREFSENMQLAFENLIRKNGEEEKKLAVELGQIDSDGIPWTDVIGDGQWSQRSFNQRGKAKSGSAVLLGTLSKKPIFVGIRNKACYICKTQPEKLHDCFKNYEGTSSGMECSIIREGFEKSIAMHGLRYKRFIGDGDSSVFVNIKEVYLSDPNYFTSVQKITCKLHAIRAMNRNLLNAERNSNPNSGYRKVYRDILSTRIHRFGKFANYIIGRHIEMKPETNAETLKKDLKALPYHIFGVHTMCSDIICHNGDILVPNSYRRSSTSNKTTYKPPPDKFFESTLWKEIVDISCRLSEQSTSLLYNMNTNLAESFQSHINKFCGGRRSNNILRGSYNRKVQEATFSFMYGPAWYVNFYSTCKFEEAPVSLWSAQQKCENRIREVRHANPPKKPKQVKRLGKSHVPAFFSRTQTCEGDKDYGPHAQKEDMELTDVEFAIAKFLAEKQVDTKEEQWAVHLKTIGQHTNPVYKELRHGLITASVIGNLVGLRNSTSNVCMIDKLLHPADISNLPAVKWGTANEKKARALYEEIKSVSVSDSGLFISRDFTAIAATPDGLVGTDGLLEIKCPYNERYGMPESVADRKSNSYLQKVNKDGKDFFLLKKTSHYYWQVVQQLHVTNRKWCDFLIWTQGSITSIEDTSESVPITPEGHLLCIRIFRDEETEKKFETIFDKCQRFFYEDLGPEIVDSRLDRNMGYRQPEYRMTAIDALKKKKTHL